MTSSPHGPYVQGYTRATMGGTERSDLVRRSQSHKAIPSSDWSLQLDSMKLESLVIGGQLYAGEYVLGSCTHCPSRQQSWGHPKSHFVWAHGGISDEDEVETRQPQGNLRLDHLLSMEKNFVFLPTDRLVVSYTIRFIRRRKSVLMIFNVLFQVYFVKSLLKKLSTLAKRYNSKFSIVLILFSHKQLSRLESEPKLSNEAVVLFTLQIL